MRLLLLLLPLLLIGCQESVDQQSVTQGGVINGLPVTESEDTDLYYSAVSMMENGRLCSGILISKNVVLTAAHCVDVTINHPSSVLLGNLATTDVQRMGNREYRVEKIIPHPDYSGTNKDVGDNDIALLILEKDVRLPYKPLKIYGAKNFIEAGVPVYVSGFSPFSTSQRQDMFEALSQSPDHTYTFSNMDQFGSTTLLMRSSVIGWKHHVDDKDAFYLYQLPGGICSGDSGGPTTVKLGGRLYLIGINKSVMGGNVNCERLGSSTTVIDHKKWILDTVAAERSALPIFEIPRAQLDKNEQTCGSVIHYSTDAYTVLYKDFQNHCTKDYVAYVEDLDQNCFKFCKGLKGFAGQCEFFSKGKKKLLQYVNKKCSVK